MSYYPIYCSILNGLLIRIEVARANENQTVESAEAGRPVPLNILFRSQPGRMMSYLQRWTLEFSFMTPINSFRCIILSPQVILLADRGRALCFGFYSWRKNPTKKRTPPLHLNQM